VLGGEGPRRHEATSLIPACPVSHPCLCLDELSYKREENQLGEMHGEQEAEVPLPSTAKDATPFSSHHSFTFFNAQDVAINKRGTEGTLAPRESLGYLGRSQAYW
jgi:hypothetical protein